MYFIAYTAIPAYIYMYFIEGKPTARTHIGQYVANKATKYEKSSGLEESTDSCVMDKLSSLNHIGTLDWHMQYSQLYIVYILISHNWS